MTRRRDESGTALVEFTWLALLMLIPLVYIMLAVFDVQRHAFAISEASRAAARAYSLAPDAATGQARANQAARIAMRDQGIESGATPRIHCEEGTCGTPGSVVVVYIEDRVVLPLLPDSLGSYRPTFHIDSTQRVPWGTYRSAS